MRLAWDSWRTMIQGKEGGEDKSYQGNQDLVLNMLVTVTEVTECLCRNELRQCASLHKAVGLRRTQRV